jgi:hypothetical protein
LSKAPFSLIAAFINTPGPDGHTYKQTDHVFIDKRQHSSILDVRSFRGADCDTDHYLVVAKIRERLAVSKRPVNTTYMDRFNLKKLNEGNRLQLKAEFRLWRT